MLLYYKGTEALQRLISTQDQKNPNTPPTGDEESLPEPVVHWDQNTFHQGCGEVPKCVPKMEMKNTLPSLPHEG